MSKNILRMMILILMLFAFHAVSAQEAVKVATTAPMITGSASGDRLRFTAPNSVVQMQLQVLADSGQILFDVTAKGNVLDWTLQDSGGQRLQGSYATVITVKSLSGKLSVLETLRSCCRTLEPLSRGTAYNIVITSVDQSALAFTHRLLTINE